MHSALIQLHDLWYENPHPCFRKMHQMNTRMKYNKPVQQTTKNTNKWIKEMRLTNKQTVYIAEGGEQPLSSQESQLTLLSQLPSRWVHFVYITVSTGASELFELIAVSFITDVFCQLCSGPARNDWGRGQQREAASSGMFNLCTHQATYHM